jgi:hypothetical protein
MYTNSQILAAVVSQWLQPLIGSVVAGKVGNIPMLGAAENWVKNLGIVSPNYSIMRDLMPIIGGASDVIIVPMLNKYLSMMDDASLPAMAHGIVDQAIENGELSLAEGYLTFEEPDLKRLKRLLELNLPLPAEVGYIVKTE